MTTRPVFPRVFVSCAIIYMYSTPSLVCEKTQLSEVVKIPSHTTNQNVAPKQMTQVQTIGVWSRVREWEESGNKGQQVENEATPRTSYNKNIVPYTLIDENKLVHIGVAVQKTAKETSHHSKDQPYIKTKKRPLFMEQTYYQFVRSILKNITLNTTKPPMSAEPFPAYCKLCKCEFLGDGLYTDCSQKYLLEVITGLDNTTVVLNMSLNRIYRVISKHFRGLSNMRVLDLSSNVIIIVGNRAFQGMPNLEILLLHDNKFVMTQNIVRPDTFEGLHKLRLLTLQNSVDFLGLNGSQLNGTAFKPLYSLEALYVDGNRNISFDVNFLNTKLTHLSLSGAYGTCGVYFLMNETFLGLPKLQSLDVENCWLVYIDHGAFSPLKSLKILNISNNNKIHMNGVNTALQSLVTYNCLTVLDIQIIYPWHDAGCKLTAENMASINALPIKYLHMDYNNIDYVSIHAFEEGLSSLLVLTLKGNRLFVGLFMYAVIFNHPSMEILDAGNQFGAPDIEKESLNSLYVRNLSYGPKAIKCRQENTTKGMHPTNRTSSKLFTQMTKNINLLAETKKLQLAIINLTTFILTDIPYRSACISFEDTVSIVKHIDYSQTYIPQLTFDCFTNMSHLEFLNMSGCRVVNVTGNIFGDLQSLKMLDFSNNDLENVLDKTDVLNFSHLPSLKHLSLAKNRVHDVQASLLKDCNNLQYLDFSGNYLTAFELDLKNLKNLSHLNLAKNRLQTIDKHVREVLNSITQHNMLEIDLTDNKLSCSCKNIEFAKWILESKVNFTNKDSYECFLINGTKVKLNDKIVQSLLEECFPYLPIILGCTVIISSFLVSVFGMIAYRYRWNILYLYFMYKVRGEHGNTSNNSDNGEFRWDAFPSYDDADATFVGRDMRENLENGRGLRLYIRHRDFPLAELYAVNISNAVKLSRKTILILSKQFLKNKWCNFELNMARMEGIFTNRSVIIVVLIEEIPTENLPRQVIDLLRECNVLELPNDESFIETFWMQLDKYIRNE